MNKCPVISFSHGYITIEGENGKGGGVVWNIHDPHSVRAFSYWLKDSEDSPFNRLPEALKLADVLTADIQFLEDKVADLEERLLRAQAVLGRVVLGEVTIEDCEAVIEDNYVTNACEED